MILILMGVAGAGKSTIGPLLAKKLQWKFYEGDDFHTQENIEKMNRGTALSDQDRNPWLSLLQAKIITLIQKKENAIIACSALKEQYRKKISVGPEVRFIYLKGNAAMIKSRLATRTRHFFNPGLLPGQFEQLEEPAEALVAEISASPAQIVNIITRSLKLEKNVKFDPGNKNLDSSKRNN